MGTACYWVNIEEIIESFGITLVYDDLKGQPGYYLRTSTDHYIVIDKGCPIKTQRWAMAHELAHFLMPSTQRSGFSFEVCSQSEEICNLYAAAILMPASDIKRVIGLIKCKTWSGTVRKLSNLCGVPFNLANKRLRQIFDDTNLCNQDDLFLAVKATSELPLLYATEAQNNLFNEA